MHKTKVKSGNLELTEKHKHAQITATAGIKQHPVSLIPPEMTEDSDFRHSPYVRQSSHFHFHQSICPPLLLLLAGLM